MAGNPLLLFFLGLGLVLLVALGVLAFLQRRMFREHARQVEELLREARELQAEGGAAEHPGDDEVDPER